jgi:hypothetical protein
MLPPPEMIIYTSADLLLRLIDEEVNDVVDPSH